MLDSSLYVGTLRHRRFRPRAHEFTYSLFMAFLDIDRIPETMRATPVSGYNRFNWASFRERDHFGDPRLPLRERLRRDAESQGVHFPDGPVYLLTHLRYLGYCFNPISLYYCFGREGGLEVVLAEVNSTFGESTNYWLGPHNRLPGDSRASSLRFHSAKKLHVSPFMDMDLAYEFTIARPEERLVVHMNTNDSSGRLFDATLTLRREPWSTRVLTRALARHPWMTAKVISAIHFEALRLWWKGAPVYTRPKRQENVSKR